MPDKLRQKNIRITGRQQAMLTAMLNCSNKTMAESNLPEMTEADFCRYLIQMSYDILKNQKGWDLPDESEFI